MTIEQIIATTEGRARWAAITTRLLALAGAALEAGDKVRAAALMRSASVAAWRAETV